MSSSDTSNCNFCEFIPTKRKRNKEHKQKENKQDMWIFSEIEPGIHMIKCMLSEAVSIACKLMMDNHVYKFDNKFYIQSNEGSIGVMFTGVASEIKMLKWCLKLKEKLKKLNIVNHLQARLVDDITLIPEVIPPGMKIKNDELVLCRDKEKEDKDIEEDVRTMKIIQEVANHIDADIN